MLQNLPTSIYKFKIFSGVITRTLANRGRGREGTGEGREERGMGWEKGGEGRRKGRGSEGDVCVMGLRG